MPQYALFPVPKSPNLWDEGKLAQHDMVMIDRSHKLFELTKELEYLHVDISQSLPIALDYIVTHAQKRMEHEFPGLDGLIVICIEMYGWNARLKAIVIKFDGFFEPICERAKTERILYL